MKNLFLSLLIFSQLFILSCSNNIKNDPEKTAEEVSQYYSTEEKAAKMKMDVEANPVNNLESPSEPGHIDKLKERDSLSSEYNNSGNMKRFAQDYQGAIIDYTKAIGITSMFHINEDVEINSLSNRGFSKFKIQDYTGAIPDFSKVIKMGPELAQYQYGISYFFRGLSKLNLQDYNGTIADFNMIIEMDPKYSRGVLKEEVYYYRGFTYLKLNQKDNACLDLSKAGELGYGQAYELIKQYCN